MRHHGVIVLQNELDSYWYEKFLKTDLNTIAIHPHGGTETGKSMKKLLETAETEEFKRLYQSFTEKGVAFEVEAHAHSWLLEKDFFGKHPEWFRMNAAGDRVNDFNMCFSNKDALAHIEKRAAELAKLLPVSTNRYFLWIDDVKEDALCCCGECSKLSGSDQNLLWCNAVIKGLRKVNPEAELSYLAYFNTSKVPKQVEPEKGIFLEYAPFERDSYIEISNKECAANYEETKYLSELLEFFGKEKSQVLEYWLDNTRFSQFKRPYRKFQFDAEIMRRDLEYYSSMGFENFTSFACAIDLEYAENYGDLDISGYCDNLRKYV